MDHCVDAWSGFPDVSLTLSSGVFVDFFYAPDRLQTQVQDLSARVMALQSRFTYCSMLMLNMDNKLFKGLFGCIFGLGKLS